MGLKIISWNVNGIRAIEKKGFIDWWERENPDILCLQETKASEEQIPKAVQEREAYLKYYSTAEKKGYSGVATYSREKPISVARGFGNPGFDSEGRILITEHESFYLFNIYYPNGKASSERLRYKMKFYDAFLSYADDLRQKGKHLIICGDFNTAHTELDLARPRENEKTSGFLPEERAWIDTFISHGYIDAFRMFTEEGGHYSWWDYKTRARERNIGWRIDYFFVSASLDGKVVASRILKEIEGSDHCPVTLEINI